MVNFLQALQYCIDHNLVFAVYRLPHSDAMRLIVQKSTEVSKVNIDTDLFKKRGFLVAPFVENELNYNFFIKPDLNYSSVDYDNFDELQELKQVMVPHVLYQNGEIDKKEFIHQVEDIRSAIMNGSFEKAVLSRIKVVERKYRSKLVEIFQLLSSSYSNAFVYLFNAEGQMWIGASPEPLLCSRKNELDSVALAGTRELNDENLNLHNWSAKERLEQEYVTRFILTTFKSVGIEYIHRKGPYTKKAGNLVHLRTDFTLDFEKVSVKMDELIKGLHPTSAVCGLPKKEAMEFLLKLEKHNRSYYSGFLGPVNLDEKILLFVNLRCMQVLSDRLVLHIGAGITRDSNPIDEWEETEIKADTLLSVIYKI